MTCREFVELVTDYFDGALSADHTSRFEDHIAQCRWCALYMEQMRTTVHVVGRIDAESISPQARDELLHAFRDWHAS
jgi:anti-sigma factor RsiW